MEPTLVEAYLPLVHAIARTVSRTLPPSVDLDDLVHDGVIGLVAALRRYDPSRRVVFSTYAGHRIRGAMLDGLRARDPLPRGARRPRHGAGVPRACPVVLVELEQADAQPADESTSPEVVALERDLRSRLWQGVRLLPPRDRQVLEFRMVHGLTLRLTAVRLGLSVTRTAEIQARALRRLRRFLDGEAAASRSARRGAAGGSAIGPRPLVGADLVARAATEDRGHGAANGPVACAAVVPAEGSTPRMPAAAGPPTDRT